MKAPFLLILFIFLTYFAYSDQEQTNPTVKISSGKIEGRLLITKSGSKGYVFQGIPYVQPPLGRLRFAKPMRKSPWNGTLICHEYKSACPQNATGQTVHKSMDEDCLYANVYQGVECNKKNLCPVLYYIHSGGYEFDAATMFEAETLVENFASKNLIFVTLGYRLGVLGFWSTGTDDAIGNWAMEDMVEGARWIQTEIKHFGGDKSKVTVMGYSSSAMAISLLSMSDKTVGLFHQLVIMSGTSCQQNAISNDVSDYQDLAVRMNCAKKSDWRHKFKYPTIIRCMRKVDPQLLVNEFNELREGSGSHTDDPHSITLPRNDGRNGLFPYPLKKMIADRRPIRTMTGTVKNENGFMKENFMNATALTVAAMCQSMVEDLKLKHRTKIQARCVDEYILHQEIEKDSQWTNVTSKTPYSYWTERTVELYEDVRYFAPTHKEVTTLVSKGATVYLYSFDYEKTGQEGITPYHSFDLAFLIGLHPFEFDERDKKIQTLYLPLFVNFTKYGIPTVVPLDNVTWTPVTSNPVGFNYLSVDIPSSMKPDYHKRGVIFWNYKVPAMEMNIETTFKSARSPNGVVLMLMAVGVIICLSLAFLGIYLHRRKHNPRAQNDARQRLVEAQNESNYDTFKTKNV